MNKNRQTANLSNVITFDENGNMKLPESMSLTAAPHSSDNSLKVPSTAWVRTHIIGLSYATTTYVDDAISGLVDAAPGALDTLNELAAALGDDANFATTVTTSIATKVPQTRTITINGTAYDLSADRSWTIAAGLTSFNTRTGAITLSSGDVTTALGYTPVTNARTITINGTTYDLSADRSWTIAGGVTSFNTRTGAITLSSADVTGALGFTPYNATNPNGYITGVTNISGYASMLNTTDTRTISPSSHTSYRLTFGFTSYANNNTPDYADYLHLRSYGDSSGGADNLITFKKNGIGMRIWQQAFGSATAYSSYVDVIHSGNHTSYRGTQLISPNGASVVAADSAMPDTGHSFIHTLGLGPGSNDGHILGMTWANTTTVYGAQIWVDTDPTSTMAFRSRSSGGAWTGWNTILHSNNYSSYALALSGGTVTGDVTFGNNSTSDQGIKINYGNYTSGYGRIRFLQDGSNHQTIHSFSSSWQSGSLSSASSGAININGGTGVTFGGWNNVDCYIATGGSAWFRYDVTAYSDRRVKDNITVIPDALQKVQSINGVTFTRLDKSDPTKRYAGVIAQEVLEVLPEVVSKDSEGMYSVSYGNMVGLLIEAIKEQQTQIEELKTLVNALTK